VGELADSSGVLHDPAILRRRLAEAGYLFFRGLLPDGPLRTAMAARPDRWTSREVIVS
jgi:hypothetical protein